MLEPGDFISRNRHVEQLIKPVSESVMVHSLQYNPKTEYLTNPVTYVAILGVICAIASEL